MKLTLGARRTATGRMDAQHDDAFVSRSINHVWIILRLVRVLVDIRECAGVGAR
jgi:hypothetical protein